MIELPAPVTAVADAAIDFVYSFRPLAEQTVVLVPPIVRTQTASVADMIGMDEDTVSYVLGLLVCYPLGLIIAQIPYGKARHLFSFLLGAFLLQFVLHHQWIHQLISSLVAYAMMVVLPRKTLKTALPAFAMLYLTLGHLHRQYINYLGWDLDFTGPQMVLTMKLYMIAFNLYDGENIAKGIENRASKKCAKFAIKEVPGIIEFLGYTFCFSNLLAGPATEFSTYLGVTEGTVFKTADGKPGKVPSNIIPTIVPLLTGFVMLGLHLYLTGLFPLLDTTDPQNNTPVILTEAFLAKPWIQRYFHCWVGLLGIRMKYYFGWKNAEGAQNIWYAGFDGFDEKTGEPLGWETSKNINILGFELAPDVQLMTKNWNTKTSFWLTRYVYIRTGGNLFAVYSTSAFWHGFYPGYYIFFLSVPLLTFCDRLAKKKLSPLFSKSQLSAYGILGTAATTVFVNYMILPFIMLAGSWSLQAYKSHYFFGHIAALAYYLVLSNLPTPKKEDKPKTA